MNKPTAFVTGAAQGIGLATVARLARDGFRVVAMDRHAERLQAAVAALQADGQDIVAAVCDVCDRASVAAAFDAQPRVDALVCAAGIYNDARFLDLTETAFRSMLGFICAKELRCCKRRCSNGPISVWGLQLPCATSPSNFENVAKPGGCISNIPNRLDCGSGCAISLVAGAAVVGFKPNNWFTGVAVATGAWPLGKAWIKKPQPPGLWLTRKNGLSPSLSTQPLGRSKKKSFNHKRTR
jgi:NAD(P)-dependent dehydrogenase (short-subunit alcohol dehydrogenase family)